MNPIYDQPFDTFCELWIRASMTEIHRRNSQLLRARVTFIALREHNLAEGEITNQ